MAYDIGFPREEFIRRIKALEEKISKRLKLKVGYLLDMNNEQTDSGLFRVSLSNDEEEELKSLDALVEEYLAPQERGKNLTRFLVVVGKGEDAKRSYDRLPTVAAKCDASWVNVEIPGLVLEKDFTVRRVTMEESAEINDAGDRYSASK